MNNVGALRTQVEQLRIESAMKREKTSKTLEEMKNFCLQHQDQDHLIIGFKKKDPNPFKPKELRCDLI